MSQKIRIILHGKKITEQPFRDAVYKLREEGASIDVRVTWEGGDGIRYATEAVQEGFDTVVAAGGDGTINEVATGMMRSEADPLPSLGVVPMGTANDFAHASQIPLGDPETALRLIVSTNPRFIDIGKVQDRYFVNVATGGTGTQITVNTPEEMKQTLGGMAYLLTGLTNLGSIGPCEAAFTGEDLNWKGRFYALAVGNGRMAGGGLALCPEALLNDGLFDVNILTEVPQEERGPVFRQILKEGLAGLEHHVVHSKTSWVEIDAPGGMQVNLDGEPLSFTHIRLEILKHRLRLHLPDNAPMLPE